MTNHSTKYIENKPNSNEPGKRPCYDVDVYMQYLRKMQADFNVTRVFLVTDSSKMIELTKKEKDFDWIFIDANRKIFDSVKFIEFRPDTDNASIMKSTVADINLAKYGEMFIGGFASYFSFTAYLSMVGREQRILPFYSIDLPFGCNSFTECKSEEAKKASVDDILFSLHKSQEWLGKVLGGPIALHEKNEGG